jgi:putative molybdopterin biosynthesis protein
LKGAKPAGYSIEARSHNAVVAAVEQGRVDWGVAVETVARQAQLGFLPLQEEDFDFAVPLHRMQGIVVKRFAAILHDQLSHNHLRHLHFRIAQSAP